MLKKYAFLIKKILNRRYRLLAAILTICLVAGALFFSLSAAFSRYILTINNLSVLTPHGFNLGRQYDFRSSDKIYTMSAQAPKRTQKLILPLSDNRKIIFKYPDLVNLGRPTYLGSDISQSVDFIINEPPANGLIQVWLLSTSLDDFLESSKNSSSVDYLSFESKKEKQNNLAYTLWDYTFKSESKVVRGLEAFFDDTPYMYRISVFLDNADYNEKFQAVFDGMVRSVKVE